jgi:GMP synthase (glutamine-hydrolysing)
MEKIKIAINECYPNRAKYIKKLIEKTKFKDKVLIEIFPIYQNKFPDDSYDCYFYSGGIIQLTKKKYDYVLKLEILTRELAKKNKPILGICLGHHIIAESFGGKVEEAKKIEIGFTKISKLKDNLLLNNIPNEFYAFNNHDDYVSQLPKDFNNYASSEICKTHMIMHKSKPIFGIQFHPEYGDNGRDILIYCKEEIIENGLNFNKILETEKKYSDRISIQIMENFIEFVLNIKKNN